MWAYHHSVSHITNLVTSLKSPQIHGTVSQLVAVMLQTTILFEGVLLFLFFFFLIGSFIYSESF